MLIQSLAILAIASLLVVYQILKDRTQFPKFVALETSQERRDYFRTSVLDSAFRYGVLGVVGLYVLGELSGLIAFPAIFEPGRALTFAWLTPNPDQLYLFGYGLAGIVFILFTIITILPFYMKAEDLPQDGVMAMLARNWKEAKWSTLLSINAGVSEEIFFRLMLPLAAFHLTGNILISFGIAALYFGIAHAYQGIGGIIVTGVLGLLFTLIYVLTAQLWLVILIHILVDLRGLILLPWALGILNTGETEAPSD
ncbi:CPBP family intramembrane glutamic endopeptidase [Ponticaulis sp.]|uniref:CPBP family intramembrane glutamic endopeptidase n=1 Tax=Ponticaulis sp. TaxID=2020902 RepID=UPI000B737AA9|nr:type II CAAX endopeptidase family protein [Ponticaulis sp.]MAI88887.1 hypothetical protein [Ponticaulis sp.]OUY01578.1 MAG: hypothetical protein CBB65_00210 [Hyphomonadaceae bacterium TMED5]|tara:strand:- start:9585 stop:10346 length:762 start_codon:yes stop_codon:yes gene_type:complete